jgi:hypothetical protein
MKIRLSRQWWREAGKREEGLSVAASRPLIISAKAAKPARRKPSKSGRAAPAPARGAGTKGRSTGKRVG